MSIYEVIMLLCFGASWPFSVIKTYKSKSAEGKSSLFLILILIGYSSGIINKIIYNPDIVTALYAFNASMVLLELILYYKYKKNNASAKLSNKNQIPEV